jgi:hypothetical protein
MNDQATGTAPTVPAETGADLEHDWGSDVERVEHGFAPLMDTSNPKGREQREAEARTEAGDGANAPILKDGRPLTSEEEATRYQRLRSLPSAPAVPIKGVIVNGVAVIVKAGAEAVGAAVPPEVQEVLENEARPLRTAQAQGLGNGLPTYDLTSDTAANPPGSASEAIAAAGVTAEPDAVPPPAPASRTAPAPRPAPRPPAS